MIGSEVRKPKMQIVREALESHPGSRFIGIQPNGTIWISYHPEQNIDGRTEFEVMSSNFARKYGQ